MPPCAGKHDIYFPEGRTDWDACRAICNQCPKRQKRKCLDEGLATYREFAGVRTNLGMWGGLTPAEIRVKIGDPKACVGCGVLFVGERDRVRFCSRECVAKSRVA